MTGVILAGGRSSRFGSNKALAPFGERTLVEQVALVMTSLFKDVVVVTNTPREFAFLNLPMIEDMEPYEGPLGAIRTVFEIRGAKRIFVSACDMPLLNATVIQEILKQSGEACAAIPVHNGRKEYLMAMYSAELLPEIQTYMNAGGRSLHGLLKNRSDVAWIPIEEGTCVNINTREELERLHAH